jgi:hypothetical protein
MTTGCGRIKVCREVTTRRRIRSVVPVIAQPCGLAIVEKKSRNALLVGAAEARGDCEWRRESVVRGL